MNEWQPIETVPTPEYKTDSDGSITTHLTDVLISDGCDIAAVTVEEIGGRIYFSPLCVYGYDCMLEMDNEPTHWMPLPKPPNQPNPMDEFSKEFGGDD